MRKVEGTGPQGIKGLLALNELWQPPANLPDPLMYVAIGRVAPTDWRNALSLQRYVEGPSGKSGSAGRLANGRGLTSLKL